MTQDKMSPSGSMQAKGQKGFTLVEVLLAVAITALAMVSVTTTFLSTLRAREEIDVLAEETEAGQRILNLLERDLQGLWHHNIKDNKIFLGRNIDIGGYDADRIDFLTSTDSISSVPDRQDNMAHTTLSEVGYWLKENRESPGLSELWRREDPMIDDDIKTGGTFQLVSNRLRSFNLTYYDSVGYEAEPIHEWDSSQEDTLPRRIHIEFTIERKASNANRGNRNEVASLGGSQNRRYSRHIAFDRRMGEILKAGVAMIPIAPGKPEPAEAGGGPAGPEGAGGLAGMEKAAGAGSPMSGGQTELVSRGGGDRGSAGFGPGQGAGRGKGSTGGSGARGGGAGGGLPPGGLGDLFGSGSSGGLGEFFKGLR